MELVIVDGHNVVHAWGSLKRMLGRPRGIEDALEELVRRLSLYGAYSGVEVILVLDGKGPGDGRGEDATGGVRVLYSGARHSADSLIEKLVRENRGKGDILVATSDRQHGTAVIGLGGGLMSAREFEKEVDGVVEEARSSYE